MPGAAVTFEFKPTDWKEGTTSWWKDSAGVDPGKSGCHIGTNERGEPNGGMFGEARLPDGMLVESNPSAGDLHSHKNDVGHPDKFDCNAWCVGKGSATGNCVVAAAPPVSNPRCASVTDLVEAPWVPGRIQIMWSGGLELCQRHKSRPEIPFLHRPHSCTILATEQYPPA